MANRYMKTCTTLQITREMKIKTTKSYHHTTVRMAITKKNTNNKCWRECEEREPLYTVGGNVSWGSHREKQYRSFSKNKTELPYDPTALPRWFSGKESAYQCKRHKRHQFNPWVGKISWRKAWESTRLLAWKVSWTEEPCGLQFLGLQESRQT